MKRSYAVRWLAGLALGLAVTPLAAQTTVQRAVDVLNRPPTAPVVETRRTTTTVIVPRREVIIVERVRGVRRGWWKHPRYQAITLYYDGTRFYRRPFDRRMLRKVVVYQSGGRYYIDEEQWRQHHDRRWGHEDRWKDDDDRGHDDKWKGDDDRDHDDKWKDGDKRKDDDDKDESKGNNGHHYGQDPDHHKEKQ